MKRDAVMELAKQCAVGELCDKKVFSRLDALEKLEARVKKLEQHHCEHEFSNTAKGCLESIFCSKCGALHSDWKAGTPGCYYLKLPDGAVHIDGCYYWPKEKKGKKK